MPKFARIATTPRGTPQWAVQDGDELIALGDAFQAGDDPADGLKLAREGVSPAQRARGQRVDPAQVQWLMPVARPGKVICLGLNYAAHAAEGGNKTPDYPSFFLRANSSLLAHQAPMVRPRVSDKFDFEAELAVVIGQRGRHLSEANALDVVAGYACFNDGSLRDYQRRTPQWTIGKNFDATGAFGPWLVPASDLPAGAKGLKIESRLNGKVMQSDNTANMVVSTAYALQLLSEAMTLEPGDVIIMGTPAGVGYARTPPVFMQPGDRIEIEIEGVGLLSNPVVAEGA
jgi:2-keto-4-pentenoate hydratase/2-oxohepta-3-ene-1,7-dioic acid hydratase in catechol pathway